MNSTIYAMLKIKSNRLRFVLVAILFLSLLSCNAPGEIILAKEEVAKIRTFVKAKNVDRIFSDASPEFREAADVATLKRTLEGKYHEIGSSENFELLQTRVQKDIHDGRFLIILVYEAKPSSSIKMDEFVFSISDGVPKLFNYRYELR